MESSSPTCFNPAKTAIHSASLMIMFAARLRQLLNKLRWQSLRQQTGWQQHALHPKTVSIALTASARHLRSEHVLTRISIPIDMSPQGMREVPVRFKLLHHCLPVPSYGGYATSHADEIVFMPAMLSTVTLLLPHSLSCWQHTAHSKQGPSTQHNTITNTLGCTPQQAMRQAYHVSPNKPKQA
jgi:hypothetical protein